MVGVAAEGVEQLALARSLEVGDGALDQVAGAVHLVPVTQVFPAHIGLDVGEVGVEVAVGLLGGDDLIDHVVDHRLEFRVGVRGQRVGGSLDPLGGVRVAEDQGDMRRDFAFEVEVKGADTAGFLEHAKDMRQGDLAVRCDPWRPEGIMKMDVRKGDGVQLAFGGHGSSFVLLRW